MLINVTRIITKLRRKEKNRQAVIIDQATNFHKSGAINSKKEEARNIQEKVKIERETLGTSLRALPEGKERRGK